jgi:mitochondrial import inner membrane translocase subunit TIM16
VRFLVLFCLCRDVYPTTASLSPKNPHLTQKTTKQKTTDASKTGAAAEAASSASSAASAKAGMALEEAHKILGTQPGASREELLRRATHLFRANDEAGSFYLTSKVYRARERIEMEVGPLEEAGGGGSGGSGGSGGGSGGGGGGGGAPPGQVGA